MGHSKALLPGRPRRVLGRKGTARERFEIKVDVLPSGCWEWHGSLNGRGYGLFTDESGGCVRAHRWAYEHYVGPIAPGLTLDHLCADKRCVNPAHLEPVTALENYARYRDAA